MKKTTPGLILLLVTAFLRVQAAVVNPDKPLKGEWDLKLTKVWEINKAGDDVFGFPFSLTATDDGTLYVHDPANKTRPLPRAVKVLERS
jgi:hypothetical protein